MANPMLPLQSEESRSIFAEFLRVSRLNKRVEDFHFSTRAYNCAKHSGLNTLADLIPLYPEGFYGIRNIGRVSVAEIQKVIETAAEEALPAFRDYLQKTGREAIAETVQEQEETFPADEENAVSQEFDELAKQSGGDAASDLEMNSILQSEESRGRFAEFLRKAGLDKKVEDMDLTKRSYNCAKRNGLNTLADMILLYPEKFYRLRNMGAKSVAEMQQIIEAAVKETLPAFQIYQQEGGLAIIVKMVSQQREKEHSAEKEQEAARAASAMEQLSDSFVETVLENDFIRQKVISFYKTQPLSINNLNLSIRCFHCLQTAGINDLAEALSVKPEQYLHFRNFGKTSLEELQQKIRFQLEIDRRQLMGFLKNVEIGSAEASNASDEYSEELKAYRKENVRKKVLSMYRDAGFNGLSFRDFRAAIPAEITDQEIKTVIGTMLAENILEYVDFRCYRVYPSFSQVLKEYGPPEDSRDYQVLSMIFSGMTLEETAKVYSVTKETVRQVREKTIHRLLKTYRASTGLRYVDEDYYAYLYDHYNAPDAFWTDYLHLSSSTIGYLRLVSETKARDRHPIQYALDDLEVSVSIRTKIHAYQNSKKIKLDGIFVPDDKYEVHRWMLSRFCQEGQSLEEFIRINDECLRRNQLNAKSNLFLSGTRDASLTAYLQRLNCAVIDQERKLRYYDFAANDYTELYEALSLDAYHNTIISAQKLFVQNLDTMSKYDIRDCYELHFLLRQIGAKQKYPSMSFERVPTISFDEFDRDAAILEIITMFSPISQAELVEYLEDEYGYNPGTIMGTYLVPFKSLYHEGVYSVEFAQMPDAHAAALLAALPEPFYYIDEVKNTYRTLFPDADMSVINPRALKVLGFSVYSGYVIKGHSSAEQFFEDLLTRDDLFDIQKLKKRYASVQLFYDVFRNLCRKMELLQYDKTKYMNIRRLREVNMDKADLEACIDIIEDYVDENTFFTTHSLKLSGLRTKLDALGLGTTFVDSVLQFSGRFVFRKMGNITVFYKGDDKPIITLRDLALFILEEEDSGSIEVEELRDILHSQYGIANSDSLSISEITDGTEYYYDKIMNKIYKSKEYYYSDILD